MAEPLAIHLLGRSRIERNGVGVAGPRGRKAWALLAYLLATESPPSREWLAELLFGDADDPLNALSWNLSELRRALGPGASLGGDPVELTLLAGAFVDVLALGNDTWQQADAPRVGSHELLEGSSFPSSPAFEVWLLTERRRLAGAALDAQREAARSRLAAGDTERAIELARHLVMINALDEDAQELLIRAYAMAGDPHAASRQRDACVALFRRELGTDPSAALFLAAEAHPRRPGPIDRPPTRASAIARLEAGASAIDGGAFDAGIASLREAVAEGHILGDAELEKRSLLALGSALVHGVRGRDGEGAGLLHQALLLAEQLGDGAVAARAQRELAYVETLRGRYQRADRWLRRAASLATGDAVERAWVHAIRGVALGDVGHHGQAIAESRSAVALAEAADVPPVKAWALTFIGRAHLLRGELPEARQALQEALETARRLRWMPFVPLPEALLGDVELADGDVEAAAAAYEHAYELSLQFGDPCWEGMAARGLGLVAEERGDGDAAIRWLAEARTRCVRLPDAWLWVEAHCLDALAAIGIKHGRPEARTWIADLEALASRSGMRELVARAYLHRSRLGDPDAAAAAQVLVAEIDNPALGGPVSVTG